MRDVNALHPKLQQKIAELKQLCEKNGLHIGIGECLRTAAEQDALYAQGRTKPGNRVTNAKGSSYSSQHQWGIAFDFYRNDGKGAYYNSDGFFQKTGSLAKSIGLGWGGDWKSPVDLPHLYLPTWGSTPAILKQQYGTPEQFRRTWVIYTRKKLQNIPGMLFAKQSRNRKQQSKLSDAIRTRKNKMQTDNRRICRFPKRKKLPAERNKTYRPKRLGPYEVRLLGTVILRRENSRKIRKEAYAAGCTLQHTIIILLHTILSASG